MAELKEQRITDETVREKFFDIPNTQKQIATRQLTFIGKVERNSDDHIPTKYHRVVQPQEITRRCTAHDQ